MLLDAKEQGWLVRPELNGGHRDLKQTSCPGDFAYNEIGNINYQARTGTVGEVPSIFDPEPLPRPKDDEMYTLIETVDTGRLYAYSGSKLFHIKTMAEFWAMVALGSFPHVDAKGNAIARRVTQAQVDLTLSAVNRA